jgi:hypothetical protein
MGGGKKDLGSRRVLEPLKVWWKSTVSASLSVDINHSDLKVVDYHSVT